MWLKIFSFDKEVPDNVADDDANNKIKSKVVISIFQFREWLVEFADKVVRSRAAAVDTQIEEFSSGVDVECKSSDSLSGDVEKVLQAASRSQRNMTPTQISSPAAIVSAAQTEGVSLGSCSTSSEDVS